MIRLDRSASTVLVVCDHPGCYWRGLANSDVEARSQGVTHESQCHPTERQFRSATRVWMHRQM